MGTGALSPEKSSGSVKLTIQLYLMPSSSMMELYFHSSIRLQAVVVN
jgi:hypothetical protein